MSRGQWWNNPNGMLQQQPMPAAPPVSTPVRGTRVNFQLTPAGTLVTQNWQTLLRATGKEVTAWQITLSPVFRQPVGPDNTGLPTAGNLTGSPRFRMTFGAGGVTWRAEHQYPVAGAAFTVAADYITLEVMANDGVTAFTVANVPGVVGWISERAAPQTPTPLCIGVPDAALVGPFAPSPWIRALHVFANTAGATLTVAIVGSLGTLTIVVPSGTRIPWPANGMRYSVVASAGNASACEEIAYA